MCVCLFVCVCVLNSDICTRCCYGLCSLVHVVYCYGNSINIVAGVWSCDVIRCVCNYIVCSPRRQLKDGARSALTSAKTGRNFCIRQQLYLLRPVTRKLLCVNANFRRRKKANSFQKFHPKPFEKCSLNNLGRSHCVAWRGVKHEQFRGMQLQTRRVLSSVEWDRDLPSYYCARSQTISLMRASDSVTQYWDST